jgi:predicted O-methyltransferase YrrM
MKINKRSELHLLLNTYNCQIGVELGVSGGGYSNYLLSNHAFKEFYCIDSWTSRAHKIDQYITAYNRLKHHNNVNILRADFTEIRSMFEDNFFDFIYIDGYAADGNDPTIQEWYQKLKPGGIYSGHDYHKEWNLTIENVDKLCRENNKKLSLTHEDKYPSWWFIK